MICVGDSSRISREQRPDHARKLVILRVGVGNIVSALELDAYREIIAGGAAAVFRLPRVPGARTEGHVLDYLSVTADEGVG